MSLGANDPPVFDKARVLGSLAGDNDLFVEVVDILLGDLPVQLDALRLAYASVDFDGLHAAAHRFKGSVSALMAGRAVAAAAALEQACQARDRARLAGLYAALTDEAEALAHALRAAVR